jgi:DNA-binding NarL/FixJ family response regulator
VKVLLVDDHHLIRDGMRPLLERLAAEGAEAAAEVFEAETFEKAIATIERHPDLDLVLLDLRLPGVTHFDALEGLRSRYPALPVVLMSGDEEPDLVRGALDRGALGYIPKSSPAAVILHALRLVLSGGTYIPPQAIGRTPNAAPVPSAASISERLGITPRQADVLALLLAGKSNKVISRELNLAESTVKNHVAAIFRVLDVTTRVQALLAASKLGIKT